jgi:hypothetical protein
VDHCRAELGDGFVKLWNRAEEEEAGSRKQGEQGGCGETFPSGATPGAGMLRGAGSCEDGGVQVGGWVDTGEAGGEGAVKSLLALMSGLERGVGGGGALCVSKMRVIHVLAVGAHGLEVELGLDGW